MVEDQAGTWTWRFDPAIFGSLRNDETDRRIVDITCPVVAIHGEHSALTSPELATDFERRLGRTMPLLTIPGAHHHVPLDAPEALAAILPWLPETRSRDSSSATRFEPGAAALTATELI